MIFNDGNAENVKAVFLDIRLISRVSDGHSLRPSHPVLNILMPKTMTDRSGQSDVL